MASLRRFFDKHRTRLARLFALSGVLLFAFALGPSLPRGLDVEIELPPTHRDFVEVRVSYLEDGQELQGARLAFPDGAPARIQHTAKVPTGQVEVRALAVRADGHTLTSTARVATPSDGPLHIRLAEPAL